MPSMTVATAYPPVFQVSIDPKCVEENRVRAFVQHTIWLPEFATQLYPAFPTLTNAEVDEWLDALRSRMFCDSRISFINSSMPLSIGRFDERDFNNLVLLVCASGSFDVLNAMMICFGERM